MTTVFFDLDGTLLHYTRDYDKVIEDTFRNICGQCENKFIEIYSENFYDYFENIEPNPYYKAFNDVPVKAEPNTLTKELKRLEAEMCQKPNNVEKVLGELSKNHELGIITNGVGDWQRYKLKKFNLIKYFNSVIVSYEVGEHKPNQKPFLEAQKQTDNSDIVMIGDSVEHDINPSENIDWRTYHYNQEGFDSLLNVLQSEHNL